MHTKSATNDLREYRVAAGLQQSDVASLLGFASTDRISRWETGDMFPHITNLFKLAIIYNTTPELLYRELYEDLKNKMLKTSL